MKLFENIGKPATLEQMAEESAELAQACLKAARKLRGENPTPKTMKEITDNLEEEMADVLICMNEITDAGLVDPEHVHAWKEKKEKRLAEHFQVKEGKLMRVMRTEETETDKLQVGDTIELLHGFTATCQEVTEQGAIMLFDQYVAERCINKDNTNEEGFEQSDLCGFLMDNIDEWIPNNLLKQLGEFGSLGPIRLPYLSEMVGKLPDWAEEDGKALWPLMANKRNRIAFHQDGRWDWCWCMNKVKGSAADFCFVHYLGFAYGNGASNSGGVRPAFLIIQ